MILKLTVEHFEDESISGFIGSDCLPEFVAVAGRHLQVGGNILFTEDVAGAEEGTDPIRFSRNGFPIYAAM